MEFQPATASDDSYKTRSLYQLINSYQTLHAFSDMMATDGSGHINVLNSERLNSGTGPMKVIHGYATPSGTPGKLSVHLETVIFDAPCMYNFIDLLLIQ